MIPALCLFGVGVTVLVIVLVEAFRCGQAEARAQLMRDIGRGVRQDDDIDELIHNLADEGSDILKMEREHWS